MFALGERVSRRATNSTHWRKVKKNKKQKKKKQVSFNIFIGIGPKIKFRSELLIDSSCSVVHCSRANYVTRQRAAKQWKAAKSGSLLVCTHLSVLYTIKGHCLQKLKHPKAAPINKKPSHMQADFRGRLMLLISLLPAYWHHTEWADISAHLWKFYSSF